MSKVDLSKEEIVHLAHCVIQIMQCEWEGCTITLNSWDTLAKVINLIICCLLRLLASDFSSKRHYFLQVLLIILQLFPALDKVAGFACRITR
jgi:hypothetical protein